MAKIIVLHRAKTNDGLTRFLEKKMCQSYWQKAGWEYYVIGHSHGDSFFFTKKGIEFNGKYARIDPEKPNAIRVFDEEVVKIIKNLLRGYGGGEVLIEIV